MIGVILLILAVSLFILLEAFFSGSELAFLSASRAKILRAAKGGSAPAVLAKALLAKPELLLSTTVLGTTIAMNFSTALCTFFVIDRFGRNNEWITLVVLTPILLTFGEFAPKILARAKADSAVLKLAKPLTVASSLLYPLTRLFILYARTLRRLMGEEESDRSFFLSREEIQGAITASRGSDVTPSERWLIARVLEFSEQTTGSMLRPLIDVIAIEQGSTVEQALRTIAESGHSRIPVFDTRIDRIVGLLHGFDCLQTDDLTVPVKNIMKPALFIPDSKPLDELLVELKQHSMAFAVNEYGGVVGIVTMEDVIEEVVGDIEDEYDTPPKLFHRIGKNAYLVNARMEITALREALRIPIPESDDYQTLAGFLLKNLQEIPAKWDRFKLENVEYIVQSATDRSIEEVYVIIHDE